MPGRGRQEGMEPSRDTRSQEKEPAAHRWYWLAKGLRTWVSKADEMAQTYNSQAPLENLDSTSTCAYCVQVNQRACLKATQKCFSILKTFKVCVCMRACVHTSPVCTCPGKPGEGIRFFGTVATGDCYRSTVGTGK